MATDERQYLALIKDIIENGDARVGRGGAVTKSVFGRTMRFDLSNNKLPLFTTKRVFLRGIIEELLFFLRGETDTKTLEAKGVSIWSANTSREFLDSLGLNDYPEGKMGPMYGALWRNWGGIDQLKTLIDNLKKDPFSRRHVVSCWDVTSLDKGVLNPCHILFQMNVNSKMELSCQMYQRSADTMLGVPFNVTSYALLTHIIAKATGLVAKEFIHVLGDVHIYQDHFEGALEQIQREPFEFPTVKITRELNTISDIEQLTAEDFVVENYTCHATIKMKIVV